VSSQRWNRVFFVICRVLARNVSVQVEYQQVIALKNGIAAHMAAPSSGGLEAPLVYSLPASP
jgi:hypothetical protein